MGKEENFKNKINTNGFDKNPHKINKTGANRKSIASVNLELEKEGFGCATAKDITDCYLRLINIPIPELTEMIKNENQPVLIRIVGKSILSGKGFDILEKMLSRAIGTPTQTIATSLSIDNDPRINISIDGEKINLGT
jgi:hypothetical protein